MERNALGMESLRKQAGGPGNVMGTYSSPALAPPGRPKAGPVRSYMAMASLLAAGLVRRA